MKTPKQVKATAMGFAEIVTRKMTHIRDAPDERTHADLWYSMHSIRQYLDQMESQMLLVLKSKGVYKPAQFDLSILEEPKKTKSRKSSGLGFRRKETTVR